MFFHSPEDPFNHKESGYWDFEDHSVTNTAAGASVIGHGENENGVIISVPERSGKVMQCSGTDASVTCFSVPPAATSAEKTPCLR